MLCGLERPEGSGDFHFDLHHPEGLFGQVVGEGDVEVDEEAQDIVFESVQSSQEIVSGTPFGLASIGGVSGDARQFAMV